ncbi:katanin p80 WD40 repeat-containing subunit B1-like protein 1 [Hibiscus syriacus]|uniref:Katanin p80 WD40 repeat-containing subunit B1-like protein 1 n=1 Tax=Hibiscus syriacus TaxID=106335 RepID=A0A6A2X865_HIBSY|nr:katanin p80 WD40 repeat-containing subunit B1-like protein 1 [Hibiscus syriacus]
MGCGSSKADKNEALRLSTEVDKTPSPSPSSYPSPSPSHLGAEVSDSPLNNESPISPAPVNLSYMKAGNSGAVTFMINPSFVEDESLAMAMPPPPPPPFESGSSWDFFDPVDDCESFRFVGNNGVDTDFEDLREIRSKEIDHGGLDENNELNKRISWPESGRNAVKTFENDVFFIGSGGRNIRRQTNDKEVSQLGVQHNVKGPGETLISNCVLEQSISKREKAAVDDDLSADKEDPSEFITHRAKDFLSSIKDIEHRFFRASEAGREVSKMLESNKIRVGYSEAKGGYSAFMAGFQLVCCRRTTALASHDSVPRVTKVIRWKRSASWRSSSSRNPLTTTPKDDAEDSGSDFIEEFCMIAGSHSSTLDRLFAWERKLYDEVERDVCTQTSESIRKEYDQKCDQLRNQFAKDHSTQVIDKTRAVVKDLHSRIRVALHSVNTISKRIEKMRDEELQPQLVELIQGLSRMWKVMLECHHSQYITISLAYHSRNSTGAPHGDTRRQILAQLRQEIECFGVSFTDWVNSLASYLEAMTGWLQNCIIEPQERSKNRYPFSPRRYLGFGPPILILFREWSAGVKALPAKELTVAIKAFLSDLSHQMDQQVEQLPKKEKLVDANDEESKSRDGLNMLTDGNTNDDASSKLCCIQTSLTRLLERLNRFSEASLKMYEDVRQKTEAARITYLKLQAN